MEQDKQYNYKCKGCNRLKLLVKTVTTGYNKYGKPIKETLCYNCHNLKIARLELNKARKNHNNARDIEGFIPTDLSNKTSKQLDIALSNFKQDTSKMNTEYCEHCFEEIDDGDHAYHKETYDVYCSRNCGQAILKPSEWDKIIEVRV